MSTTDERDAEIEAAEQLAAWRAAQARKSVVPKGLNEEILRRAAANNDDEILIK